MNQHSRWKCYPNSSPHVDFLNNRIWKIQAGTKADQLRRSSWIVKPGSSPFRFDIIILMMRTMIWYEGTRNGEKVPWKGHNITFINYSLWDRQKYKGKVAIHTVRVHYANNPHTQHSDDQDGVLRSRRLGAYGDVDTPAAELITFIPLVLELGCKNVRQMGHLVKS